MANAALDALIADAKKTPKRSADEIIDSPRMMDTIDEFMSVANAAIKDLQMAPDLLEQCRMRGCRTHLEVWRPHAIGFVGKVTNGRFFAMIQKQIEGMRGDLSVRQYNGDWRLASAKFETFFMDVVQKRTVDAGARRFTEDYTTKADRRRMRFFLLGVEFIDIKGSEAAQFSKADGMPIDTAPTSASPEVQALLEMARAVQKPAEPDSQGPDPSVVSELQAKNDELSGELSQVKQMLEQLLSKGLPTAAAKTADPAPPAKPKRSRRRRTTDDKLDQLEQNK